MCPAFPARPEQIHSLDVLAPYLDTIEKLVDWEKLRGAKLRFVVDPMHGSARGLLLALMRRHGVACDEIRGTRDPLFGGVNPEPIEPHVAALRDAVRAGNYDAGFAADGDGDRIGAMDRDGTFITPHQVFSILFWHLAGTRQLTGDLAKTFSTTKLLDKIAARFGRRVHETPVGFKYICELMLERDILLGGEESGGIGTKLYLPERDATVVALLLAEVMAWHRKSLGELVAQLHAEFGEHHYGRVDHALREPPRCREHLRARLVADHALQVADERRIRRWPDARADDVVGVGDVRDPVADRGGDGLLQRPRAGLDRLDGRAEQPHPLDVRLLPAHVLGAHVDDALEIEQRARGRRRDAVLAGAGLGDDPRLPIRLASSAWPSALLILCAPVWLRSSRLSQIGWPAASLNRARLVQRRGTADVGVQQAVELGAVTRIVTGRDPRRLELGERRHQRLWHVLATVRAEAVLDRGHEITCTRETASANARSFSWSLTPGRDSTPRRHVDRERPRDRDRVGDVVGRQAARQDHGDAAAVRARELPVERLAGAAEAPGTRLSSRW